MDKEKLIEHKIWRINVSNRDKTTLMYIADSKLEAIVKYYEHVKLINDPEHISVNDNFDVGCIGYAYE